MKQKKRALPKEIFLSHASADREFADRLAKSLRREGIAVWYSRTHLRGAQEWQHKIGQALRRCDWFVVILSPNSVNSMWVKRELSYALIKKRFRDRIVPVVYRKCNYEKLHWTLSSFQMVDVTVAFADGYHELLKTWGLP